MKKSEAIKRWNDEAFFAGVRANLERIFVAKKLVCGIDLSGIIIGLDGVPSGFEPADFQDVILEDADISFARFSCPFSRANIQCSNFVGTTFDTCRFKNASFSQCDFSKARISRPTLDDTSFDSCCFLNTRIGGGGSKGYGGRRTLFRDCDFTGTIFQNIQLRAVAFENCKLDQTVFKKCYLAGIKVNGETVKSEIFEECHVQSAVVNGEPLVV